MDAAMDRAERRRAAAPPRQRRESRASMRRRSQARAPAGLRTSNPREDEATACGETPSRRPHHASDGDPGSTADGIGFIKGPSYDMPSAPVKVLGEAFRILPPRSCPVPAPFPAIPAPLHAPPLPSPSLPGPSIRGADPASTAPSPSTQGTDPTSTPARLVLRPGTDPTSIPAQPYMAERSAIRIGRGPRWAPAKGSDSPLRAKVKRFQTAESGIVDPGLPDSDFATWHHASSAQEPGAESRMSGAIEGYRVPTVPTSPGQCQPGS